MKNLQFPHGQPTKKLLVNCFSPSWGFMDRVRAQAGQIVLQCTTVQGWLFTPWLHTVRLAMVLQGAPSSLDTLVEFSSVLLHWQR